VYVLSRCLSVAHRTGVRVFAPVQAQGVVEGPGKKVLTHKSS
jgi:hypothetical protein